MTFKLEPTGLMRGLNIGDERKKEPRIIPSVD